MAASRRNDVLAAAANRSRPSAAPATRAVPAATPSPQRTSREAGSDDGVEFTKARRATAEHMVRSLATSARIVATEVDYHHVDPVRRRAKLSYLPFVARATIDALREFGHLNASVGDDELIVHRRIHLGIAVDVGFEALVVPVVKDAGDVRLVAGRGDSTGRQGPPQAAHRRRPERWDVHHHERRRAGRW